LKLHNDGNGEKEKERAVEGRKRQQWQ